MDREGGLACISPGVGASRGGVLLGGTCCKMSVLPEVTGVKPLLASLIFGLLARMTRVDECMAGLDATPGSAIWLPSCHPDDPLLFSVEEDFP